MKQTLNTQRSFAPCSTHYSIISKSSFRNAFVFLSAFLITFITGCKKNELQDSSQQSATISKALKQNDKTRCVPFKASFTTMDELTQLPTDANPIQKDFLTGTGKGTMIGNATEETYAEGDVTLPFPALVTSTTTFVAANGDKIFAKADGYLLEPSPEGSLDISGPGKITGGTGRFAGATGSFVFEATGNIFHPEGHVTFTGTICY